ncbi:MAG: MBL fold metallo-hydrolase [Calditrichaeota bacterium]|nr:MBL fold metallo-hydrolase [Calditrichota bacterium]MCB0268556.1 MBL fold metallo-hydrolase [Calditrichota bacterium]MCB0286553.1 MBL fold metallo-hydrolase [Calditrichota bacterium]
MRTRYCILASGSRGNSIFLEANDTRFLIDVGLSAKQIELRLKSRGVEPSSIDAIVLTHAHRDHVHGVGTFAQRHKVPVIGHPDTLDSITNLLKIGQEVLPKVDAFEFGGVRFKPFRVPHDCDPTHGYLIETATKTFGICTDLGYVTGTVQEHICRANILLLESNHDPEMLNNGKYPWDLKQRIAGRFGHLSNQNAGELLYDIFGTQLDHIILGHLSDENNTPELALKTVLRHVGDQYRSRFTVMVQKTVSDMFTA